MKTDTIRGRVERILFEKDGFFILNLSLDDSNQVETAKGILFGLSTIKRGVPIQLTGTWGKHPQHGRQLNIQNWDPVADNVKDVEDFLAICVNGFVDRPLVRALVKQHGMDTFQRLTEDPGGVQANPPEGVDPEDLAEAILGWETTMAARNMSTLLKAGGLAPSDIRLAVAHFGTSAPEKLKENPFRLMEVPGVSFSKVDRLARGLGVMSDDPRRVEGAILWAVQSAGFDGHLYVRREDIPNAVTSLLAKFEMVGVGTSIKPFEAALHNLLERKVLVYDPEVKGLYTIESFKYERESADLLAKRMVPSGIQVGIPAFLEEYERTNKITLSEAQRSAVEKLSGTKALVLTGLPGTGKTTCVRAIVRYLETAKLSLALMAPTGIAAKRLSALTGHPALTIHRALKYDGVKWFHNANNRYVIDAVIVDEMSMVDQELFFRLLSSIRPETIVVLVGDDAQLPSVGPGNVLRELVSCPDMPSVRLTQIFRQSETGGIVLNSHRINRGDMIVTEDPKNETEFKFVRVADEARIADFIVNATAKLKSRDENFQVLSAKHDGEVGVIALNERLRDRLNPPGAQEWKEGDLHFRLGDRLMVIRNDYKLGVYNGDVGKLTDIHRNGLVVKIYGNGDAGTDMEVRFTDQQASEKLRLAYAITVHKSQGSEFDTIFLPIVKSQGRMLQRNLLYTAVTRARKRVWLIGEEGAVQIAIANNIVRARNTSFGSAVTKAYKAANGVGPNAV